MSNVWDDYVANVGKEEAERRSVLRQIEVQKQEIDRYDHFIHELQTTRPTEDWSEGRIRSAIERAEYLRAYREERVTELRRELGKICESQDS